MIDSDTEARYSALSDAAIREMLGWMHIASVMTYRNDEGTEFDAQFDSFWEHYRLLQTLANKRGIHAYTSDCPIGIRDLGLYQVLSLYLYASKRTHIAILLDRPLTQYLELISRAYTREILFLCKPSPGHLITNLDELGISYRFLGIPIEDWAAWKARPEYKGVK